ncbi:hypothetical protein [Cryptosporangium sp. NPDC051539]|uniref:hypothetical protein n=1 Tax=Cryptosporangium sp. NPDC051539 TaxID=3363962 RepID=UPI0037AA1AAA
MTDGAGSMLAGATDGRATSGTPTLARTLAAGCAGGLAFVLATFLTFGLLGGSRRGHQGLLFDPDTQSPKVIAVWKALDPLPRIIETPVLVLAGLIVFGVCYALLYRSVAPAWPRGLHQRSWRLALAVWLGAAFSEFMGPFNVLHEPPSLAVLSLGFWAVAALAEAYLLVFVADRGRAS